MMLTAEKYLKAMREYHIGPEHAGQFETLSELWKVCRRGDFILMAHNG